MEEDKNKLEQTEGQVIPPPPRRIDQRRAKMREKYPDIDMDDDDTFFDKLAEDYDSDEEELITHREQAQKMSDMFTADPRSASVLQDLAGGEDIVVSLVKRFGEDTIREALDNPDNLDKLAEANRERLERLSSESKYEEEYKRNIEASDNFIGEVQTELGLTDEQVDEVITFIHQIVSDGIRGIFKRETIEMALKALNYDQAIATAQHEGEVAGRNAKISEKLRKTQKGDGLPQLGGASNASTQAQPQARRTVFEIAREGR